MTTEDGHETDTSHYTLDQIRNAFWRTFHKGGDVWFDYLGTEEEVESSTEGQWQSFVAHLKARVG